MIKGIIYDMDGVLVDTEFLHFESWNEVLSRYGYNLTLEKFLDHWTRKGKGIKAFVPENKLDLDINELKRQYGEVYLPKIGRIKPLNNSDDVVRNLSTEYKSALATSSFKPYAAAVLKVIGLENYLNPIVTAEDVRKTKPAPDAFLLAARVMELEPESILVVEDAEKGIVAANRAGMKSIAIPTQYTRNNDFSLADRVIEDIRQLTPEFVRGFN